MNALKFSVTIALLAVLFAVVTGVVGIMMNLFDMGDGQGMVTLSLSHAFAAYYVYWHVEKVKAAKRREDNPPIDLKIARAKVERVA